MRLFYWAIGPRPEFKVIASGGKIPKPATQGAAGFDLFAPRSLTLDPGITTHVPLNIESKFNPYWQGQIWDRSSFGGHGVHRLAGLIDSDFRNNWKLVLVNHGREPMIVNKGDRIAQVTFVPCYLGKSKGVRRGGFGSTGA